MVTEKRGGRRVLSISPELFIEFCKHHDGRHRTYTVAKALPDDARIVEGNIAWGRGGVIEVILESAEWQDDRVDALEHLDSPVFTLHWLEETGGDDDDWAEWLLGR